MANTNSTGVLHESHVQTPVQRILDAPVTADCLSQSLRVVAGQTADKIAAVRHGLAIDDPFVIDGNGAGQVRPVNAVN